MRKIIFIIILVFCFSVSVLACDGPGCSNTNANSNVLFQGQSLNINSRSEGTDIPPEIPDIFPGPGPRGVSPAPNIFMYGQAYDVEGKTISVFPVGTKLIPVGYGYYFLCTPMGMLPVHLLGVFTEKAAREGVFTTPEPVDNVFSRAVHRAAQDYDGDEFVLLMQDTPRPQLIGTSLVFPSAGIPTTGTVLGGGIGKNVATEERVSWLTTFVFKVLGPPVVCQIPPSCKDEIEDHLKMLLSLRCSKLSRLNGEIWKEVGLDKIRLYFCTGEESYLREAWLALRQSQRNFRAIKHNDPEIPLLLKFAKSRDNGNKVRMLAEKPKKSREFFQKLPQEAAKPKRVVKQKKEVVIKKKKHKAKVDPLKDLRDFVINGPFSK